MLRIGCEPLNGRSGHDAGRELLAKMYSERNCDPMPFILTTDRGKPFFASGRFHFSISHTPKRVFCALADYPLGIDAEEMDRDINLVLADKILSPAERKHYDAAEDKRSCLLRFWVLKEAAAKASGEGLRGYPNVTAFHPDDPRIQEVDGCYLAIVETEREYAV
ncbi:MAG: 4'-phosphopantetheinyl transferase superfamily protein [Oscillospiraceae bacterium]|nr:4'-phosphopantetheinyl transferase superfamily protein [Oscillospiraceae bacterium]